MVPPLFCRCFPGSLLNCTFPPPVICLLSLSPHAAIPRARVCLSVGPFFACQVEPPSPSTFQVIPSFSPSFTWRHPPCAPPLPFPSPLPLQCRRCKTRALCPSCSLCCALEHTPGCATKPQGQALSIMLCSAWRALQWVGPARGRRQGACGGRRGGGWLGSRWREGHVREEGVTGSWAVQRVVQLTVWEATRNGNAGPRHRRMAGCGSRAELSRPCPAAAWAAGQTGAWWSSAPG